MAYMNNRGRNPQFGSERGGAASEESYKKLMEVMEGLGEA